MSPVLTIAFRENHKIDDAVRESAEGYCRSPARQRPTYFSQAGTVLLSGRRAHITYQYDALGRSTSYAQLDNPQRSVARRLFDKASGIDFDGRKRLTSAELKSLLRLEAEFDKQRSALSESIFRQRGTFEPQPTKALQHGPAVGEGAAPRAVPWHAKERSPLTIDEPTAHLMLRENAGTRGDWRRSAKLLETPRIAQAAWSNPVTLRKLLEGCQDMREVNELAATHPALKPPTGMSVEATRRSHIQAVLKDMLDKPTLARTVDKTMAAALDAAGCGTLESALQALQELGIDNACLSDMLRGPAQTVRLPALLGALFERVHNLEEAVQIATRLPWNTQWSLTRLLKHPGVADRLVADCRQMIDAPSVATALAPLRRFFTGRPDPQEDSHMNREARRIIWADSTLRERLEAHIKDAPDAPAWLLASHTDAGRRATLSAYGYASEADAPPATVARAQASRPIAPR